MLLTRYKSKLAEGLSYPVGAELLSRKLEPHRLPEIELSFSDNPMGSMSEFLQVIEKRGPQEILRASFWRWEKSISVGKNPDWQKYLQGVWSVQVFPVRRSLKSKAREALATIGLPLIVEWLIKPRDPVWYHGSKACLIEFHPDTGTVEFRERPQVHDVSRGRKFRAPVR